MLHSNSEGENPRRVPPREVLRVLPQNELFPEELIPFYCPYCHEDKKLKFGEVPSCIVDSGHFSFKKKKICPNLVDRYSAFPRPTGKTQLVATVGVSYDRKSKDVGLGIVLRNKSLYFVRAFSCYGNKPAIENSDVAGLFGLIVAIDLVNQYRDLLPDHGLNNVIFYMSSKNAVEAFNGIDPHGIDLERINEARRKAGLTEFQWNGVSNKLVKVGISQPLFRSLSVKYIPSECNQIADQLSLIKNGCDSYNRVEQMPKNLHLKIYELLWHDIFVIHQLEKNLQGMPTPNNWQHEPTSEGEDHKVETTKLRHRLKGNMNQQVKVEIKKWTAQDRYLIPIQRQAPPMLGVAE